MLQSIRLFVRLSIRLSVTPFHYVPVIVSSWKFQELLPLTEVMPKGQGERSNAMVTEVKPNLAVSGL